MSEQAGYSEFNYTIQELREIWAIRNESLDPYFAMVQWLKRRDGIDDAGMCSFMRSKIESMERIAEKNNAYDFDKMFDLYRREYINPDCMEPGGKYYEPKKV